MKNGGRSLFLTLGVSLLSASGLANGATSTPPPVAEPAPSEAPLPTSKENIGAFPPAAVAAPTQARAVAPVNRAATPASKTIAVPKALSAHAEQQKKVFAVPVEAQVGPDAERDFSRGKTLLDEGKESEALVSFTDFLRRYPKHALADDSQYLIGEIWFRRRKFEMALEEFRKVLNYGAETADRVGDAAVRMGECWVALNKVDRARVEWEAVLRKFPKSEAGTRAGTLLAGAK